MPRYKLVELDEHGVSLEIDPVRLKRLATAFKAWLMTIDPDNDPFCFLKKDLPLVESALDGTMQLPFPYNDRRPHTWEGRESPLPKIYNYFSADFYLTVAGILYSPTAASYKPPEVIMKDGRYYAWAEFENPEDSGFSGKMAGIRLWLNSRIQKILRFLDLRLQKKMVGNLEKSRLNHLKAIDRADIFISSGSTPPVATPLDITDTLVKVVPAGEQPSARAANWLRPSELDALQKEPANMANKLSLPPWLHADQFDVYEISPNKQGVLVFESTIAPTTFNGKPHTTGGATQTIVFDRNQFTPPIKIGSINTKKGN